MNKMIALTILACALAHNNTALGMLTKAVRNKRFIRYYPSDTTKTYPADIFSFEKKLSQSIVYSWTINQLRERNKYLQTKLDQQSKLIKKYELESINGGYPDTKLLYWSEVELQTAARATTE